MAAEGADGGVGVPWAGTKGSGPKGANERPLGGRSLSATYVAQALSLPGSALLPSLFFVRKERRDESRRQQT